VRGCSGIPSPSWLFGGMAGGGVANYRNLSSGTVISSPVGKARRREIQGMKGAQSGKDVEVKANVPAEQLKVLLVMRQTVAPTCLEHRAMSRSFRRVGTGAGS
jgi:hypothetical protein